METYRYKKMIEVQVAEDATIIRDRFYAFEYIINGNYKVTANSSNTVRAREILNGSLEDGFLTLGNSISINIDDIESFKAYEVA